MITDSTLCACMPHASEANVQKFLKHINVTMEKYEINTKKRIAAFLAQIAHESGSLRYVAEIASGEAYEGRMDLGNDQAGDGVRFKGRGLIQVTGRANYEALSAALNYDFVNNPEALELPGAATMSAGWFWNMKRLNKLADADEFLALSIRINGKNKKTGLPNHWPERQHAWAICKVALKQTDLP